MTKYSIIIPVYNAEKYLEKCLDTVLNQKFKDYEVIIVNDCSNDNSQKIIDEYKLKHENIRSFIKKKNTGVSEARNYGVDKVRGEYFIFVDADDYVDKKMLTIINENIKGKIDLLSFNMKIVNTQGKEIKDTNKPAFAETSGEQAIKMFIFASELFDTPAAYVYRSDYFKHHHFKYAKDRYHEDFGLTPLVILYANQVISIKDNLYYYVQSDNSITRNKDEKISIKKAFDMLYHFDYLYNTIKNNDNIDYETRKIFNSFLANAIILKAKELNGTSELEYIKELKKRKVVNLVLANNFRRIIKKLILKMNIKLYLKLYLKLK